MYCNTLSVNTIFHLGILTLILLHHCRSQTVLIILHLQAEVGDRAEPTPSSFHSFLSSSSAAALKRDIVFDSVGGEQDV